MTKVPSANGDWMQTTTATDVELRDRVLWIQLSRPEVLNAINDEMIAELDRAAERAAQPDVRVVVIRGAGRSFSVGVDLKQVAGSGFDIDRLTATVREAARVITRIATLPKPVIAGVNGLTAAGGLEIVLACDLVIAARSARLADAHSNYGLLPGGGGSFRLARLVGPQQAKRLLFTGEFVAAEELLAAGLVTEVVDDERLDDRLEELSGALAERSPRVLAAMKRLVEESSGQSTEEAASAEFATLVAHAHTPDLAEGLAAFREGRQPRFDD